MAKWANEDTKRAIGINELKDYENLIRQLLSEFVGTFLYLSIVLYANSSVGSNHVVIALANGLLIASIMQIIVHVSGGHINPAVTVGALVCGHIKVLKAILYVIAQILGAIVGSIVAYAISEKESRGNLGATVPLETLDALQAFGLEVLLTFVLVSVVLSFVEATRGMRGLGSGPFAIGLAVTGCQCSALIYTASMNPIRSLGPAVVMNIWDLHWVYWAGPLLGGFIAGLFNKFLFTYNVSTNTNADIIRE